MRYAKLLCLTLLVGVSIGVLATATSAESPYTINMTLHAHKELGFVAEHQPDFPCFPAGQVTTTYNATSHVQAGGVDGDRFLEPLNYQTTIVEKVLFEPVDPSLPDYEGHRTTHLRNYADSPNAGFTDNVVLHGSDGSKLHWHANIHVLVRPSGMDLFVDNQRCTAK